MGIKEILQDNKVALPPDFDERLNLVILGLRKDPKFEGALQDFKGKTGGALKLPSSITSKADAVFDKTSSAVSEIKSAPSIDSEDWLGPNIINFMDVITSPAARGLLKGLFMVVFFVSYLESIPVFGNILSSALDVMVAANKMITKAIQKNLPPLVGLIPIPYASLIGIILAAMYGAFVWPLIAMVAFSRQDFTAAIESFIRAIPPPFGDTIADSFLETNRMVARINAKRVKLVNDITDALLMIADLVEDVSSRVNSGLEKVGSNVSAVTSGVGSAAEKIGKFSDRIMEAADVSLPRREATPAPSLPKIPTQAISKIPRAEFEPTPVGQGRKPLTTKRRSKHKWQTKRTRSVKR
jgi:hypothetical protein